MSELQSPPTKDTLDLLEQALQQAHTVIAGIRPDQNDLSTPCADWDVRALVSHLVGQDLRNYIAIARRENADWRAPADALGDDWAAAFEQRAKELMDAWRASDLDAEVALPGGGTAPLRSRADQQVAEFAVHTWDLARATEQPLDGLDPEVADHALGWSRQMLRPEHRGPGKPFGAEVPVAESAPSYDRLAGWFGRDPAWEPRSRG